jgi:hypothetical protein
VRRAGTARLPRNRGWAFRPFPASEVGHASKTQGDSGAREAEDGSDVALNCSRIETARG